MDAMPLGAFTHLDSSARRASRRLRVSSSSSCASSSSSCLTGGVEAPGFLLARSVLRRVVRVRVFDADDDDAVAGVGEPSLLAASVEGPGPAVADDGDGWVDLDPDAEALAGFPPEPMTAELGPADRSERG